MSTGYPANVVAILRTSRTSSPSIDHLSSIILRHAFSSSTASLPRRSSSSSSTFPSWQTITRSIRAERASSRLRPATRDFSSSLPSLLLSRRHSLSPLARSRIGVPSSLCSTRPYSSSSSSSYSSSSSSSSSETEEKADSSLRGRTKLLFKKYGWAAIIVYGLVGVVDWAVAFGVINIVGADHVRHGQDYILDMLVYGRHGDAHQELGQSGPEESSNGPLGWLLKDWRERKKLEAREHAEELIKQGLDPSRADSSFWSTASLAYIIHKTLFLPVRLGVVATATPAIVRGLQRFGINIAKSPVPASVSAKGAERIEKSRKAVQRAKERHADWL